MLSRPAKRPSSSRLISLLARLSTSRLAAEPRRAKSPLLNGPRMEFSWSCSRCKAISGRIASVGTVASWFPPRLILVRLTPTQRNEAGETVTMRLPYSERRRREARPVKAFASRVLIWLKLRLSETRPVRLRSARLGI